MDYTISGVDVSREMFEKYHAEREKLARIKAQRWIVIKHLAKDFYLDGIEEELDCFAAGVFRTVDEAARFILTDRKEEEDAYSIIPFVWA